MKVARATREWSQSGNRWKMPSLFRVHNPTKNKPIIKVKRFGKEWLSYFQTKYAFHRKKIQEKVTKKKIPNRITKARKENEVVSKGLCWEIIKIADHTKKLIPKAVKMSPLIKRRGSINHESKNKLKNINIIKEVRVTWLCTIKLKIWCRDCMSCDCMIKCPYVFLINNYNEKK